MGRGWRWGWVPLRVRVSAGVTTGGRSSIPNPPPPTGDPRTVGARLGTVPSGPPPGGAAWDTHRAGTGTPSGLGPGPPAGRDRDPQRAGRRSAAVGSRGRARSRSQEVWTRRQLRKREKKKKILELGGGFFFSSPFLARNQQVWNNNSAGARGGGGGPAAPSWDTPRRVAAPDGSGDTIAAPNPPKLPKSPHFLGLGGYIWEAVAPPGQPPAEPGASRAPQHVLPTPGHHLAPQPGRNSSLQPLHASARHPKNISPLQPYILYTHQPGIPCMYHLRIPIQHLTSHTHHPCIPYTSSLHPRHNLSLPPCIPCTYHPYNPTYNPCIPNTSSLHPGHNLSLQLGIPNTSSLHPKHILSLQPCTHQPRIPSHFVLATPHPTHLTPQPSGGSRSVPRGPRRPAGSWLVSGAVWPPGR